MEIKIGKQSQESCTRQTHQMIKNTEIQNNAENNGTAT